MLPLVRFSNLRSCTYITKSELKQCMMLLFLIVQVSKKCSISNRTKYDDLNLNMRGATTDHKPEVDRHNNNMSYPKCVVDTSDNNL